ncbi:aminotransferase class III-fold pyridoxal phosphate-dependent enzyme [Priestia filamentosa]|uniref:aminotransferase class III-fold pyridoxal phosphate-dependent enzyme n=1 Tax=Priestia filamentosa TaxID=1402861 RepID=UPI003983A61B
MNSYIVPMGPIKQSTLYDIKVEKAEGTYIFGDDGKKYLDLRSGLWNVSLGYNKKLYKEINTAFSEILFKGTPYIDIHSYEHTYYDAFAKALLDFINYKDSDFHKVFYTNSGSEGTELAIKLSRQVNTEKRKIVSFKEGYHGTFFGGMAVSGLDEKVTEVYSPKLQNFEFLSAPTENESLNFTIDYLETYSSEIAAFFIEPVVGSSGTLIIDDMALNMIMETCKKNNIIVVFDEVATGFYRTGKRFRFQGLAYKPDILVLSKSINNGVLPFGTVVINQKVEELIGSSHIEHFSTQNGNILGVISALKTLEYYKELDVLIKENVKDLEMIYTEALSKENLLFRGQGAMLSIPLKNQSTMFLLIKRLKEFGILTYYYISPLGECGLTIFPPLIMEKTKFQKSLKMIIKMIKKTIV